MEDFTRETLEQWRNDLQQELEGIKSERARLDSVERTAKIKWSVVANMPMSEAQGRLKDQHRKTYEETKANASKYRATVVDRIHEIEELLEEIGLQ